MNVLNVANHQTLKEFVQGVVLKLQCYERVFIYDGFLLLLFDDFNGYRVNY
jgi:hypothetical protein